MEERPTEFEEEDMPLIEEAMPEEASRVGRKTIFDEPSGFNETSAYMDLKQKSRLNFVDENDKNTDKVTEKIKITPSEKPLSLYDIYILTGKRLEGREITFKKYYRPPLYLAVDDYIKFTIDNITFLGKIKEFKYVPFKEFRVVGPNTRKNPYDVISIVVDFGNSKVELTDANDSKEIFYSIKKTDDLGIEEKLTWPTDLRDSPYRNSMKLEKPLKGGYTKKRQTKKRRKTKKRQTKRRQTKKYFKK